MKRFRVIAVLLAFVGAAHAAQVGLIKIDGAIGPATAEYVGRALEAAASQKDECLIIQLNTPGGLADSMNGKVGDQTLHTAGATIAEIPMDMWEEFSKAFLRPEVMFVLMLMVIYGIIGELSSPGAILPGVAGVIALVLVLYMSAILPVSIAGLVLMGVAVLLFIADAFATTHGVLTAGGVMAFFLGALMLFNHGGPGYHLSLRWIVPATVLTALFFIFVVGKGVRAQFKPAVTGREGMIGRVINAQSRIDAAGGRVFIEGESWNAVSATAVEAGQPVEVTGLEGLTLKVKPRN